MHVSAHSLDAVQVEADVQDPGVQRLHDELWYRRVADFDWIPQLLQALFGEVSSEEKLELIRRVPKDEQLQELSWDDALWTGVRIFGQLILHFEQRGLPGLGDALDDVVDVRHRVQDVTVLDRDIQQRDCVVWEDLVFKNQLLEAAVALDEHEDGPEIVAHFGFANFNFGRIAIENFCDVDAAAEQHPEHVEMNEARRQSDHEDVEHVRAVRFGGVVIGLAGVRWQSVEVWQWRQVNFVRRSELKRMNGEMSVRSSRFNK